jgi:hypothetical protein
MELVANVWPVVDAPTGLVIRFFIRAYVMDASDDVVSRTLHALAPSDFRVAQLFPVPRQCSVTSERGTLKGCITIGDFRDHQAVILENAFRVVEGQFARLQALADEGDSQITGVSLIPRFPTNPYVLLTPLLETSDGNLIPIASPT